MVERKAVRLPCLFDGLVKDWLQLGDSSLQNEEVVDVERAVHTLVVAALRKVLLLLVELSREVV